METLLVFILAIAALYFVFCFMVVVAPFFLLAGVVLLVQGQYWQGLVVLVLGAILLLVKLALDGEGEGFSHIRGIFKPDKGRKGFEHISGVFKSDKPRK